MGDMTHEAPLLPGERYARQTLLRVMGQAGQQRLASSTVVVVGCGALS